MPLDYPIDDGPRDNWDDWIEHSGKGCPLRLGDVFQAILFCKNWFKHGSRKYKGLVMPLPSVASKSTIESQIWHNTDDFRVTRYRLLKPDYASLKKWNERSKKSQDDMDSIFGDLKFTPTG